MVMKISNNYYNLRSVNKLILRATVIDLKSRPFVSLWHAESVSWFMKVP